MMISVIADGVTLFFHPTDQVRIVFDIGSDDEKSGGNVMFFQGIQDRFGISVFKSGVKGQIDPFFFCVFCIVCVIFCKYLVSGVGGRWVAVLTEAQSPVAVSGRLDSFREKMFFCAGSQTAQKKGGCKTKKCTNDFFHSGFTDSGTF